MKSISKKAKKPRKPNLDSEMKSGAALSTQEVADLLNVSRPFVVNLIETHRLKSFNVGSLRKVLVVDAIAYQRKMRNEKNEALDALAKETESLGLDNNGFATRMKRSKRQSCP